MTKISSFLLAIASVAMLGACNSAAYKKTPSGLMYKIISSKKGSVVKVGEILKISYEQKLNDSVLFTSFGKMPAYVKVDTVQGQYNPTEIFGLLRKGDSAVVVQSVDSLMQKMPMGLPPYMKKGDKLTISFRVLEVFTSDAAAKVDGEKEAIVEKARMEKEMQEKTVSLNKEMDVYISSKKINAQKTGEGVYVEIKQQGTGMQADSGKYVSVRYTGRLLETGKEFESNMGADKQPFSFTIGSRQVIPGWDQGLRLLKKGAKATLYIPGTLAYGPRPGPGGKTYESLVFDVELVNVLDKDPGPQPIKVDTTKKH